MTNGFAVRVGELRPSQLLWAFGPGSLVDLPQLSVVVLGLNHWKEEDSKQINEARLLDAVRRVLGPQVSRLLAPPVRPDADGPVDPFSPEAKIGVPVLPFPKWLRCPMCNLLARYDSGLFDLKTDPYRPDRNRYVHSNCARGKSPTAVPARLLVACKNGHIDDFPWRWFVHRGPTACTGALQFYEIGASLQTENLWVKCTGDCKSPDRSLVEAFGEKGAKALPACRANHAHLGQYGEGCDAELKTVLLGASNSWFPVTMSALAIPTKAGKLLKIVEDNWEAMKLIGSRESLPGMIAVLRAAGQLAGIDAFDADAIWKAIEEKRNAREGEKPSNLKLPEWEVFTESDPPKDWPDFMVFKTDPPKEFADSIHFVLLAERLREVSALIGFTRVDPPDDGSETETPPKRAPLSINKPEWVPATEVRGEGIFLRFKQDKINAWLGRTAVKERENKLLQGHRAWRIARKLAPPEVNFPGVLFYMLHTFAHLLLRELSLECGYNAASIRERIYATRPGETTEMAGVLLYTAAPDSDGTLGGLVELGKPENLERLMTQALERACICSSDPLCAEHVPLKDRTLHGAACHACSFVAETSCEAGNRYLDRSLLVPTIHGSDLAFFEGINK